jgi:hypothetical protein
VTVAEETVKIRIEIEISTAGTLDTEVPLAEWNAMTQDERTRIANQMWATECSNNDSGGVWVVTDDAMEA